jgi:hypothetical protein
MKDREFHTEPRRHGDQKLKYGNQEIRKGKQKG